MCLHEGVSVDHSSGFKAPKSDPVFLHVKVGMTVIVEDGSDWRMAGVIWVYGGARNPWFRPCFRWLTSTLKS